MTGTPEAVVVPLRVRGAARFFPLMLAGLVIAGIVAVVAMHSWENRLWGVAAIAIASWLSVTMLAARRARGSGPIEIVATREGLKSPLWEVRWDEVECLRVSRSMAGQQPTLVIELRGSGDFRTPSKVLNANVALSRAMKMPQLQILQANVDRPLEDIAADFERIAGRELLVRNGQ